MNQDRLRFLYRQYINDSSSAEELKEFLDYIKQDGNDEVLTSLLDGSWDDLKKDDLHLPSRGKADSVFFNITKEPQAAKPHIRYWTRVAASIAIVLSVGIGIYFFKGQLSGLQETVAHANQLKTTDTLMERNRAVLILADGKSVVLDQLAAGTVTNEEGLAIKKTTEGQLIYTPTKDGNKSAELKWNTIYIPRGGQYEVVLSDGTKVYLNSESSLKYPVKFTGKERNVTLTGEGYFEVAKNSEMPFIVNVNNAKTVEVLGTQFNISAYADEPLIKTTLLEGSVKVTQGKAVHIIKPGQVAIGSLKTGGLVVKEANIDEAMAWRNGLFVFNDENISSIMTKVARWYDVEVEYRGDFKNVNMIGNYSREKSLSNLLKSFEIAGNISFLIEGRKVIVIENKQ